MSSMPPPPPPSPPPSPPQPPYSGPPGSSPYQSPAPQDKPDNYLVWSILATLFCCLPFGVVSLVYAMQVDKKWFAGDFAGAVLSADRAKKWVIASAIASAISFLIVLVLFLMGVFAASNVAPSDPSMLPSLLPDPGEFPDPNMP